MPSPAELRSAPPPVRPPMRRWLPGPWLRTSLLLAAAASAPAQSVGIQLTTGIDGGIDLPADPRFVPPTGITVEAWITYDDATIPSGLYYWPTIARQNLAPNSEVWNFRVDASNTANRVLKFAVRINGLIYSVTYAFAAGEFSTPTHVAATYDGRDLNLYKNGIQLANTVLPLVGELVYNGGTTRIGNGDPINPGHESWNGIIDELRIWPVARTGPEIRATMNQSIGGLPSGVLTFPLDGHLIDTSGAIIGTQFGTMTFVTGAAVTAVPSQISAVGNDSTTCSRAIQALVGSLPEAGNTAFAIWCTGGPRPAVSPLGLVVGAGAVAPPNQPPFFGVDLAFDFSSVLAQVALLPPTNAVGNARFPLPIPANPALAGTSLVFQFGFVDPTCGPQGFSASSGVAFTTQ